MFKFNKETKSFIKVPKPMYFDNDDEFYQFCVTPEIIFVPYKDKITGADRYYADWDFSQGYKDAVSKGVKFIIKDENSQIYKHGAVTYRVNTKPIQNLEPYYETPMKK